MGCGLLPVCNDSTSACSSAKPGSDVEPGNEGRSDADSKPEPTSKGVGCGLLCAIQKIYGNDSTTACSSAKPGSDADSKPELR